MAGDNLTTMMSDVDYGDYFDIEYRARTFLTEPHQVIALCLSILAITFNVLCIVVMLHSPRRASPHLRLLVSLAASDIMIAASYLLHLVNKIVNPRHKLGVGVYADRVVSFCGGTVTKALNTAALDITLLNLIALAFDHYLAILRPLHYPHLMSRQRANLMIAALWVAAFVLGFSDFLSPVAPYHRTRLGQFNYCEAVTVSRYQEEYTIFVVAFLGFAFMLFAYVRIYARITRPIYECVEDASTAEQDAESNTCGYRRSNNRFQQIRRNRRALITTLLIVGCFVACWLPTCIFEVTLIVGAEISPGSFDSFQLQLYTASQYIYDLFLLNCISDPIIYCLRLPEVKSGYHNLIRRFSQRPERTLVEFDCITVGHMNSANAGTNHVRALSLASNSSARVNVTMSRAES